MKYVIQSLPDEDLKPENYGCHGLPPNIDTEEEAIKEASRFSRKHNGAMGIFKLVKIVEPPDVKIKDVTN